jgi:hypothetical protein
MNRCRRPSALSFTIRLGAALLAALLAASGCSGLDNENPKHPLRLTFRDLALRRLGEPCSGSIPFLYIHKGAKIELKAGGKTILENTLPAGEAVRGDEYDWGEAPRIPTHCAFVIDAPGLTAGTSYAVFIDGNEQEYPFVYNPDLKVDGLPVLPIPPDESTILDLTPEGETPTAQPEDGATPPASPQPAEPDDQDSQEVPKP